MKYPLIVLIAALTLANTPHAYAKDEGNGGTFYYTIGGNILNPETLRTPLQENGYSAMNGLQWSQGGGVYGVFKRVLLGWEGSWFLGSQTLADTNQMNMSGAYHMLQIGYMAISLPNIQLFPYFGLGQGGITLRATETFNNIFDVSQGNLPLTTLEGRSWLLEAGLGVQYILPISKEPQGLSLGLRGGYVFAPLGFEWTSNQLPVQGGPRYTPEGFYLRATLGYSGYE